MTTETVAFTARTVITMDPARPRAEAVAVRDGRILGAGTLGEMSAYAPDRIDRRFASDVLMPGFVEGHAHVMEGAQWMFPYAGYFERRAPDGAIWPACRTIDAVIARLREAEAALGDPAEPLFAWGFDPIYFRGQTFGARDLDRVSESRPVFVFHANGHLATVNSALMRAEGIGPQTEAEGVVKDASGVPTGELREMPAMVLARAAMRKLGLAIESDEAIRNFGAQARNAGCTTVADLGTSRLYAEPVVERLTRVTSDDSFPARVVPAYTMTLGGPQDPADVAAIVHGLISRSTDKLRFGLVKLFLDGSIQGYTARLADPCYHNGAPNGMWLLEPERFAGILTPLHDAGLTVHTHCNGDEATEVFIDAVEQSQRANARADHRHTVQHSQLTTAAQYGRMAALGMCANIFSNHIYYWGNEHRDLTLGPERAARMDAAATALREGVRIALHSDAPVTPLGSLHLAWCAVNRLTATGEVLGAEERIRVEQALQAITMGAAYTLNLEAEVGSIAPGKRADFVVLGADPLAVDASELRDVPVLATVLGGVVTEGTRRL